MWRLYLCREPIIEHTERLEPIEGLIDPGNIPAQVIQLEPRRHRRSASQLEGYLRCPEGYRLERIAKAPQRPAAWLTQGIAFHHSAEKWEQSGRTLTVEDCVALFVEEWERVKAEQLEQEPDISKWLTGGNTRSETDIENRYQRGQDQVRGYIEYALANQEVWRVLDLGDDNPAVEVAFDLELNGVRIIGYIDQLIEWRTGAVTVRDLKTGTKVPDSSRQLGIYRIATLAELGIDVTFGDYYMCKNNAPTELKDLRRYTPERVGRWFKNLDDSVEAGMFTPNPGSHCRICPVERFCDLLGNEADLFPAIVTREEAA